MALPDKACQSKPTYLSLYCTDVGSAYKVGNLGEVAFSPLKVKAEKLLTLCIYLTCLQRSTDFHLCSLPTYQKDVALLPDGFVRQEEQSESTDLLMFHQKSPDNFAS